MTDGGDRPSASRSDLRQVRDFWQAAPCGDVYAQGPSPGERLEAQARARYVLEPCIRVFARFEDGRARDVLEIGVGMGADHLEWARVAPRSLTGVDLTGHAIAVTRERLALHGLRSRLLVTDAEHLPFRDASFDLVYSWGVVHHSPDTPAAVREIARVLRAGGRARVMIYQRRSLVGLMLWVRYGLLSGRPGRSLDEIYAEHLESPGTKAYSAARAREMFAGFSEVRVTSELGPGDLLQGAAGQRHRGVLLDLATAAVSALGRQALPLRLRLVPADRGAPPRRPGERALRRDASAALALTVLVAGLWCVDVGRTSLEAWRVPVDTGADAWYTLATLKAAQDGHLTPFGPLEVPELGAPHGASWNDFLRQHKLQYALAGVLARTVGLFPAANLLVLLAAVLAALSFLGVSRHLGARPEWAFAGACAFALSPFLFHRSLAHLTLSFYWPIPLAILVVAWAFEEHGIRPGSRRFLAAVAITVVTGLHNVYFATLLAQFLGLSCLVQGWRRRAPRAASSSLALLVVLVATVLADNANLLVQAAREGAPADALLRPYGNLERYALKPIELLLPLGEGGIVPWRAAGQVYVRSALYRGELGSAYLGLAGILALLGLAIATARAGLGRPRRPVPGTALALAWVFAYAVVGGLNGLLGLAGFVWLRATNRTSIWILGVVLLWGTVTISRAAWTRRRGLSVLAAVVLGSLTLADQLPPRTRPEAIRERGAVLASDAVFIRSLEAALPAGAMLFQLPVVDFPEGLRIRGASDYEHLRPYLQAKQLRFSYGSDKGRPREAWQRRVEALEPEAMADALERMGFAGLLVIRKAYEDGARELRERLAATGRLEVLESPDDDFLFIRLRPAPSPLPPDAVVPPAPRSESS